LRVQIKNATGPKAEEEIKDFTAFIRTRSWEVRSKDWDYRFDKPIDFVSLELGRCVGVELCQWLDRKQAQWVKERDRFRGQIELEIKRRGLYQFEHGGPRSRCAVQAWVTKLPSRAEKRKVIDELLGFMVEFEQTRRSEIYQGTGIADVPSQLLPVDLAPFFARMIFFAFPTGASLGVVLTKASVFKGAPPAETDSAIRSLRQALTAKTVEKAEIYEAEKRRLGLSELWLVVHYSSPDVFNAPYTQLGMQVGHGAHRRESQDRAAVLARGLVSEIGEGPFDRVFLMIACQPETYVSELGPTSSASDSP
jgi:hypothetical protein